LLSFLLSGTPKVETLRSTPWSVFLNQALLQSLIPPDPAAQSVIQQQVDALAGLGYPAQAQGIWLQEGNHVLAEHQGTTPLPAASLTKVATTLVALDTWGAQHQFVTIFSGTGPVQNGVLQGDLLVQGDGDPFFVWEEAVAVGNALNQAGITRVTGNLLVTGTFAMNYELDPNTAGALLKQGLNPQLWNAEATAQFQQLPPGTVRPQVVIDGGIQPVASAASVPNAKPIVRHRSMQLVSVLKAMNIYSNNVMSQMMADSLGGAPAVAQKAAAIAQVPPQEIQLANGSGLGVDNRISPRAVTAMMLSIQRYLQEAQLNIGNLFPVMGRDIGTLKGRKMPNDAVVKTGTLNEVSSLAGVLPTRDRGLVWFSMINYGAGDIQIFHDQQDFLLERLQKNWGVTAPVPSGIRPSDRSNLPSNRVGSGDRSEVVRE
jgi:D-alanyl-D-alanine carboxypeptidase/D-alanyl-D-alanine-endopeptidase (penicillin-binding protein 4)